MAQDALPCHREARILLAEDDPQVRRLFVRALSKQGWEVTAVDDGAAAIAAWPLCGESFDLVILDLLMPGVNGLQAYQALRRWHPEARFLFVSGYSDVSIRQRIHADGQMLLMKPLSPTALVAAVRAELSADGMRRVT